MKNFLRAFFLLIAIFSFVGIFLIAAYYIYKNIDLFRKLVNDISSKVKDLELTSKEIEKIADNVVNIEVAVEKDINKDIKKIKRELPKQLNRVISSKIVESLNKNSDLNSRQKAVLNYIQLNSDSKMSSVSKIFNKVTPRTLRRDLQKLEQMGFLKQQGKTRDAIYKIV